MSRVVSFAEKNCSLKIPNNIKFNNDDLKILNNFTNNLENLRSEIDKQNINYYIDFIVNSLFDANKYFNDQEPWKKKDDNERLNTIVFTALEIIRKITFLLYPIIPESSIKVLNIFNLKENDLNISSIGIHDYLKGGNPLNKIEILFKKIEKIND